MGSLLNFLALKSPMMPGWGVYSNLSGLEPGGNLLSLEGDLFTSLLLFALVSLDLGAGLLVGCFLRAESLEYLFLWALGLLREAVLLLGAFFFSFFFFLNTGFTSWMEGCSSPSSSFLLFGWDLSFREGFWLLLKTIFLSDLRFAFWVGDSCPRLKGTWTWLDSFLDLPVWNLLWEGCLSCSVSDSLSGFCFLEERGGLLVEF